MTATMTDRHHSALEVRHAYAIALDRRKREATKAVMDPTADATELGMHSRAIRAAQLQYDAADATVKRLEREGL